MLKTLSNMLLTKLYIHLSTTIIFQFLFVLVLTLPVGTGKCLFPENGKTVTFQDCGLTEIPEDVRDLNNAQIMIFKRNDLRYIDPFIFDDLPKLRNVDFSYNLQLVINNDKCFLNSSSITSLDIQGIDTLGVLRPEAFECCPFKNIKMSGPNCPQTKRLVEAKLRDVKFICTDTDEDLNKDLSSESKINGSGIASSRDSTIVILWSLIGVLIFLIFVM